MFRTLLICILLPFVGISQGQVFDLEQDGLEQQGSFLICSSHRNEIVNIANHMGFRVFMFDGKYCVLAGDNSLETIQELFVNLGNFLANSWLYVLETFSEEGVITVEDVTKGVCHELAHLCEQPDALESDNQAFIEYTKKTGSSPQDNTGYPELPSFAKSNDVVSLNGKRHCTSDVDDNFETWLEAHMGFWDCDGQWNEDVGVKK